MVLVSLFLQRGLVVIKEAFEFLAASFVKGDRVSVVQLPDGSTSIYGPNGENKGGVEAHPTRRVQCNSASDFIATFINAECDCAGAVNSADAATVAVGLEGVRGYIRSGEIQYQIAFDFEYTSPAKKVGEFTNETELDHKQLLRMLRTTLRSSIDSSVIGQFAKVAFASSATTVAEVSRGRDTFGKSVDNAVANAIDLPESIAVKCGLFLGVNEDITLELFVYVDAERQRFLVWIDSQAWERECERVRRAVVAKIAQEIKCPILAGQIVKEERLPAPLFN